MTKDSRSSMVRSAATLIGTHGMNATSFSDVVADSGAPRGSIYHHFPEGNRQLAEEAVRYVTDRVLAHQRTCPAATPAEVVGWFVAMWRQVVTASNATAGCTVAGVAVDSEPGDGGLIDIVRGSFRSWIDLLAGQLESAGLPAVRARSIAVATLAAMEGALILCRAEGSVEPFDAVTAELVRSVNA